MADCTLHPRCRGAVVFGNCGIQNLGDGIDGFHVFYHHGYSIIVDVKFETFGCGSAIASSSMATEMIKGKSVSDALELTNKAVVEALDGLPPAKVHCSVLAEEAVKKALKDYYDKNGIEYDHSLFPDCGNCEHCHG